MARSAAVVRIRHVSATTSHLLDTASALAAVLQHAVWSPYGGRENVFVWYSTPTGEAQQVLRQLTAKIPAVQCVPASTPREVVELSTQLHRCALHL